MRAPKRLALGVSACLSSIPLLLAMVGPVAGASTLVVDDDLACPGATYNTIQAAVNAAASGDTIKVCDGTYPEGPGPLTIPKQLTLLGEQAGVDARGARGLESIISDIQGTWVRASDVVIDGFTVQESNVAAFTGYGIALEPGVSGTQVVNNIIQDNIVGIGLANGSGSRALIEHNLIRDNNLLPGVGGASGTGIYTDQFSGGSTVRNVLIDENSFLGNDDAGLDVSNTDASGGAFDLTVTSNFFGGNGRAFVLFNTHNSTFDGNRIRSSTLAGSADLRVFDNNSGLDFTNNDLANGAGHASRLSFLRLVGGPSTDIEFHENNFVNYPGFGMLIDLSSHAGTVDATCNWWDSATGPTDPDGGNPGGAGEQAVGDINYTPWLIAPAPNGPCVGGSPSTPGKVTGGGQTPGTDPTFSASGSLLSPPAFVMSAAGPTGKASFGFVVSCCKAKGNLEYIDHNADVRIKAKSIDALFIGNGICGPNTHATFVGTATVYRATGTATESFTVDVDDCGEPGTADRFGISTDTYSNEPSVLLGGNIQIHR